MKKISTLCCLLGSVLLIRAQNVGIGTNSPQSRLHVVGRVLADSLSLGNVPPQAQLHTTGTVLHQSLANPGGAVVYADSIGRLTTQLYDGKMFQRFNSFAEAIPDNGCPGIQKNIFIQGTTGTVAAKDITLTLTINHTRNADLVVLLTAPNGKTLTLISGNGGTGQDFTNCRFTDNTGNLLPSGNVSGITGKYKPWGSTATICGITPTATTFADLATGGQINPAGSWQLRIIDMAGGSTGTFVSTELSNTGDATFGNQFFVPKWSFGRLSDSSSIYDNGNVGIGTTNPTQRLDVNGGSINKNTSCVINTSGWTAVATGSGYSAGTYFAPTTIVASGIAGDTRLINQGGEYNTDTGDPVNTGLFYAPASGFYTVSIRIKSINPGRLLMAASLNGTSPEEILDAQISGNCNTCDDRAYSILVYLNEGDTHRVLRHTSGVTFASLIISYRLQG